MGVREESQEMNALLAHRRLGRGVGVVKAAEEGREGVLAEGSGDRLELVGGLGQGVSVGELVEAGDDSVLQIVSPPGGLWWTRREPFVQRHFLKRSEFEHWLGGGRSH